MIKPDKIQTISQTVNVYRKLQKIAKTLHRLDENACNYELSKAQETRMANLEAQAEELAQILDLHAYHQTDPRGCSLHLTPYKGEEAYTKYTSGVAVF